jgi:hypothetical protein
VYVDDLTLSGPRSLREQFWSSLRETVKLDPEVFIGEEGVRVLDRQHIIRQEGHRTVLTLDMKSYAEQVVDAYCEAAGVDKKTFKKVQTPSLAESAMTDEDLQTVGTLDHCAASILMQGLWLSRLARPDLSFIICRMASRVSKWSRWEDKQLLRTISYLHHTSGLCMSAAVEHNADTALKVYTDADFASCPFTSKSTSGILIAIQTGEQRFPIIWSSKKQTSVARSTPEAEAIAMASAMFTEALNVQTFLQYLLEVSVPTVFEQDNETLLKVLENGGYSAKL